MAVSTEPDHSKKAITKRLQFKISAEMLAITGFKKLPGNLKKAIKKASKKISKAMEEEPVETTPKLVEGIENKKDPSQQPAKKTDRAKNTVKPSNPPDPETQNKIPGNKKTNKAQPKAATKKPVKKALAIKSKPASKRASQNVN